MIITVKDTPGQCIKEHIKKICNLCLTWSFEGPKNYNYHIKSLKCTYCFSFIKKIRRKK